MDSGSARWVNIVIGILLSNSPQAGSFGLTPVNLIGLVVDVACGRIAYFLGKSGEAQGWGVLPRITSVDTPARSGPQAWLDAATQRDQQYANRQQSPEAD